MKAYVIPAQGQCRVVDIPDDDSLSTLQQLVGGYIDHVPVPEFVYGWEHATAWINDEGKFNPDCEPNLRATLFFGPLLLEHNDYIAGTMVLCGYDPNTGDNADVPDSVTKWVKVISQGLQRVVSEWS
jgi:hypothetical protein